VHIRILHRSPSNNCSATFESITSMKKLKPYYNRHPIGVPANGTPERAALDAFREANNLAPVKNHKPPRKQRRKFKLSEVPRR
jgi:hypothetical protein